MTIRVQPDDHTKRLTLDGCDTGWSYQFDPGLVSAGNHLWSNTDWISFIGDHWFRKPTKDSPSCSFSK